MVELLHSFTFWAVGKGKLALLLAAGHSWQIGAQVGLSILGPSPPPQQGKTPGSGTS
jgi:hypothetical protein